MRKNFKVAILQLPSIGMSSAKLDYYLRIIQKKGVKLLVLGEYLLNPFFNELKTLSLSMIDEQSKHQLMMLKELTKEYGITIVAPLIIVKKSKIYKTVAKVSATSTSYYEQQILLNYPHWNEEKFFSNKIEAVKSPLVFNLEGYKFAVIAGFEVHFDEIFVALKSKNIDALILPTVSTFESQKRWRELCCIRAFTNNFYIVRANRIGEYLDKTQKDQTFTWKFYGDSFVVNPNGELEEHLGDSEELLITELNHNYVLESRKSWGFKEAVQKRLS